MGSILAFIAKLFGGGLAKELRRAVEAKTNAKTEQEKIDAEVYLAEVEAQTQRALAGGRAITYLQVAWASMYFLYQLKLIVWDKILGWGVTDPLSPELAQTQALILGFLFGPMAIRKALGR